MNIGVNKSLQNILVKSAITIGLTFGSMLTTMMGYLCNRLLDWENITPLYA